MHDAVHLGAVSLQIGIAAGGVLAVRRGDAAAAFNAAFALTVALFPFGLSVTGPPAVAEAVAGSSELLLWVALAGFLHVVGMLGWYDTVWWWDHLTHTVSAALAASIVYSGLVVISRPPVGLGLTSVALAGATVGFVLALGVFWELGELFARDIAEWLDIEPVLVHYGWRDTALDLVFDLVGALVVVVMDLSLSVAIAATSPTATRTALVWTGWAVSGGSALLATGLVASHYTSESR
ncbi:hypothetical protein ACFQFH_02190 [Halobaculum halobium]|uniref:Uncharacterized protein n=1 Tax=Halobaculum halobium TaxID=3032281 RepID=A0ABD5TAM0_9EURY|nr:hypothetical protein [Halobaculum sp. SYNS20]